MQNQITIPKKSKTYIQKSTHPSRLLIRTTTIPKLSLSGTIIPYMRLLSITYNHTYIYQQSYPSNKFYHIDRQGKKLSSIQIADIDDVVEFIMLKGDRLIMLLTVKGSIKQKSKNFILVYWELNNNTHFKYKINSGGVEASLFYFQKSQILSICTIQQTQYDKNFFTKSTLKIQYYKLPNIKTSSQKKDAPTLKLISQVSSSIQKQNKIKSDNSWYYYYKLDQNSKVCFLKYQAKPSIDSQVEISYFSLQVLYQKKQKCIIEEYINNPQHFDTIIKQSFIKIPLNISLGVYNNKSRVIFDEIRQIRPNYFYIKLRLHLNDCHHNRFPRQIVTDFVDQYSILHSKQITLDDHYQNYPLSMDPSTIMICKGKHEVQFVDSMPHRKIFPYRLPTNKIPIFYIDSNTLDIIAQQPLILFQQSCMSKNCNDELSIMTSDGDVFVQFPKYQDFTQKNRIQEKKIQINPQYFRILTVDMIQKLDCNILWDDKLLETVCTQLLNFQKIEQQQVFYPQQISLIQKKLFDTKQKQKHKQEQKESWIFYNPLKKYDQLKF